LIIAKRPAAVVPKLLHIQLPPSQGKDASGKKAEPPKKVNYHRRHRNNDIFTCSGHQTLKAILHDVAKEVAANFGEDTPAPVFGALSQTQATDLPILLLKASTVPLGNYHASRAPMELLSEADLAQYNQERSSVSIHLHFEESDPLFTPEILRSLTSRAI
jgi:hypothetical protein